MTQTRMTYLELCKIAGACYLHDLPVQLLYQVTRHLDVQSQRNLFLCSSQLYSRWHLQVANGDSVWQFIRNCIDITAKSVSSGICTSASLTFDLLCEDLQDRQYHTVISFWPSGRASTIRIAGRKAIWPDVILQSNWTEMTTDQFWHRLVGLPEHVKNPFFSIKSADGAGHDDIKALGQQLFTLLCSSNGILQFDVLLPAGDAQGEQHRLIVGHQVPYVHCNGSLCGDESWDIDVDKCAANPPCLQFDSMPREVAAVRAHMVNSTGRTARLPQLPRSYPVDNQAVKDFAYDGNVDVTSCLALPAALSEYMAFFAEH